MAIDILIADYASMPWQFTRDAYEDLTVSVPDGWFEVSLDLIAQLVRMKTERLTIAAVINGYDWVEPAPDYDYEYDEETNNGLTDERLVAVTLFVDDFEEYTGPDTQGYIRFMQDSFGGVLPLGRDATKYYAQFYLDIDIPYESRDPLDPMFSEGPHVYHNGYTLSEAIAIANSEDVEVPDPNDPEGPLIPLTGGSYTTAGTFEINLGLINFDIPIYGYTAPCGGAVMACPNDCEVRIEAPEEDGYYTYGGLYDPDTGLPV